jgi:hypothetical protein
MGDDSAETELRNQNPEAGIFGIRIMAKFPVLCDHERVSTVSSTPYGVLFGLLTPGL